MATNKIVYLTDDIIQIYTGKNVLTSYGDINLKSTKKIDVIEGGIYDQEIFGSMFSNQCNCGQVHQIGLVCPRCKSVILDDISSRKRYARIDLPVYYCSDIKYPNLIKFLKSHFNIQYDVQSKFFYNSTKITLEPKVLELLQFDYDKENEVILVSDDITDVTKCSFEGILRILVTNFPSLVTEFRSYINTSILVVPIAMRAPSYTFVGGVKRLKNDQISVVYQNIIYCIQEYYNIWYPTVKTESGKAIMRGTLRRYITKLMTDLSGLLRSSKQNESRLMLSNRVANSGRCTIVPAPDLKADEVYIPVHLMYECCREEFTEFLANHYECSIHKAELIYKTEADSPEVQELFSKYIEGDPSDENTHKYVFINRNPTLHELNILMCKVKLTKDYCMKIPMVLCSNFGADFDGDTMSFYAVPKVSNGDFLSVMSPKNIIYYKKNHKPLFMPNHDAMMGLIYATKVIIPDKKQVFYSLDDAIEYRKHNRDFKWQTLFTYQGNDTTLAREKLSGLFGKDLNAYLESFNSTLNSKNIIPLYSGLEDFDDRLDRIQKIQEFAFNISTLSGATAPTISQLYSDVDSNILNVIKQVESDKYLSDKEKDVKVRELYDQYVNEQVKNFDDSVKLTITESSRSKISQLMNIVLPQLNVGPDQDATVSESRLINGMNPSDYLHLAVENRAVQDIKVSSVPMGGYLTRQFAYLAMPYYYTDQLDSTNPGIELKKKDAIGRTLVTGDIVDKNNSEELVKVRSIVTSTLKDRYAISSDMITDLFHYKRDSRIGLSMITSLTEGLTQGSLALKHGGALFQIEPDGSMRASQDCSIQFLDNYIMIQVNGEALAYPRPINFVVSYNQSGNYKKGEVIGSTFKLNTPSYTLDSIITLCEANRVTATKKFARNKVLSTDCYATRSGIIHYKINEKGKFKVFIDKEEYEYNENALYCFHDGEYVNKFDRICSGTLNLHYLTRHTNNYLEMFYYFRNQINELVNGVAPEMVELMFVLIVSNVKGQIKVSKVVGTIFNSKSFFTATSFGNARKKFGLLPVTGLEFESDTITNSVLSIIMNNEIK